MTVGPSELDFGERGSGLIKQKSVKCDHTTCPSEHVNPSSHLLMEWRDDTKTMMTKDDPKRVS